MRPVVNEDTGAEEFENDLSEANFDVTVDVGPSSASKRSNTVRALTGMVQITDDPDTKQVLGAMAMMNMEGEGIAEVRDYFRQKLIKMGVIKPTDDETKKLVEEMQNQPPDPNAEFLKASSSQALAKAAESESNRELNEAKKVKTIVEAWAELQGVDRNNHDQLLRTIDALGSAFQDMAPGSPLMPQPAPAQAAA